MDGELLLDTNAMIALLAGDTAIRRRVADSTELLLSIIVLGELYYGARKSARAESNLQRVEELVARSTVIPCDSGTAVQYGIIKNALRPKGRPIPECDLWVAAVAKQHDLILVSRDSHFDHIDGLKLESW
jgi:tRNA(fMet)-specific endonuclease VapC